MNRLLLVLIATMCSMAVRAQLLTWTPEFPTDNDPITITVDATKGNKGLQGFTGNVYMHIGLITSSSTSSSDWRYAKFSWGSTEAAALATPDGTNKWKYTISNIRTFFGVPAGERIVKIAILFRAGGCTGACASQRNADGSDMYIPVYDNTLAVRFTQPPVEPKYIPTPEPITKSVGETIALTALANKPSALTLSLNGSVIQSATNATAISASPALATAGNQTIVVSANDGSITKTDTLRFFVSGSVTTAPLPAGVRAGINYESNGTAATLVLYAPYKTRVSVIGDLPGSNWTETAAYQMNQTPDGKYWWLRITGLQAGAEYAFQYLVDGTLKIADPYAQKVLDPWNDQYITASTYPALKPYPAGKTTGIVSVLQTAAPAYNWTVPSFSRPDKRGLVIYELLLRDFVANHDWKTLTDTLTYLKRLGINAIELLPINEFEGNNSWGYNPDFYFAPDKYYGPPTFLKAFIDSCHRNGIAVIMDIALNHSFGLSPMVQLYWDAANNRPAANNPWFNPIEKHPFNVGYDMNHESADTKQFFGRVVEYWLQEYKVDGFRFDLSKGFTQTNSGGNVDEWSKYDASRVAIWKGYYDTVQSKSSNSYVILEHFAANSEEKELADYGMMLWGNLNHSYSEAAMGWVSNSDFSNGLYTTRGWSQPYLVTYMESHDEERLVHKNINYGNTAAGYTIKDTTTALKRMELSAAFFLTQPGPKMIWQFGELGYEYPINYCENGTINNDCRTAPKPIRWDYQMQPRRKQVYNTYSSLINLRFHPWYKNAFISGRIEKNFADAFKWLKLTTDTSNLVVVGNFGVTATAGSVTFPSQGVWYDYLNNATFTATGASQSINLSPGEFRVYVNRNVNNLSTTPVTNLPAGNSSFEASVYPNPARSAFVVSLNLPQSGPVQIGVLNTAGQQVATIHQSFLVKGTHQLQFNRNVIKAAAGQYFLQISTKGFKKVIQITIQ